MISNYRIGWRLLGVVAVGMVIFASLMLPAELEKMRTGHWFTEHFLGYFVASLIVCLGWPRPLIVGAGFTVVAVVLEVLQSLTPNHSPAVLSVVGGASGALAATGLVKLIMMARNRH